MKAIIRILEGAIRENRILNFNYIELTRYQETSRPDSLYWI
jgi:hypothetical protein